MPGFRPGFREPKQIHRIVRDKARVRGAMASIVEWQSLKMQEYRYGLLVGTAKKNAALKSGLYSASAGIFATASSELGLAISTGFTIGPVAWRAQTALQSSTWYANVTPAGLELTSAGMYYRFVALPELPPKKIEGALHRIEVHKLQAPTVPKVGCSL